MEILDQLKDEDKFVQVTTLVFGYLTLLTLIFGAEAVFSGKGYFYLRLGVYMASLSGWFVLWYYKRTQLPRNEEGVIGIIIALQTENDKQKIRLKKDLVKRMRELLVANGLEQHIQVYLATDFQAERMSTVLEKYWVELKRSQNNKDNIDPKTENDLSDLQRRVKGNFYMWGTISERGGEENAYYIDTHVLVPNLAQDPKTHNQLAADITSIWNPQFKFLEKMERDGFRIYAEYIYVAAKTIIGMAAFISHDVDAALMLHSTAIHELEALRDNEHLNYIKARVISLLAEEHHIIAFRASYIDGDHATALVHTQEALRLVPNHYPSYLLTAVHEFLLEGNPQKALQTIHAAREFAKTQQTWKDDGTWRYSEGFLLMHMGKYPQALDVYRKIANYTYKNEEFTLRQVYAFNEAMLRAVPGQIQVLFILGFLQYKKSGNYPIAWDYVDQFLRKAKNQQKFKLLFVEAKRYKAELEKEMNLKRRSS